MRKMLILAALLLCIGSARGQTPPVTPPPSTVLPPPVLVSVDPVPLLAALSTSNDFNKWLMDSFNTVGTKQAADEAAILALTQKQLSDTAEMQKQIDDLKLAFKNLAPVLIHLEASQSGAATQPTTDTGMVNPPLKVTLASGQTLSFPVSLKTAGKYAATARISCDASSVGSLHTHLSTAAFIHPGGTGWTTDGAIVLVDLPAGSQTLAFVTDLVPGTGACYLHWIELAPQ